MWTVRKNTVAGARTIVAMVVMAMITTRSSKTAPTSIVFVSAAPTADTEAEASSVNNSNSTADIISSSLLLCDAVLSVDDEASTILKEREAMGIVDEEESDDEEFSDRALSEIEIDLASSPSMSPSGAPPCSDSTSNARGMYTSNLAPCMIVFHDATTTTGSSTKTLEEGEGSGDNNNDNNNYYHGTSDVCGFDNAIGELKEYITLWPDECVGDFARCYNLIEDDQYHKELLCPSLLRFLNTPVPFGTTHVSVDCTIDKELLIGNLQHNANLQHDAIRDVVSAKKETTLFTAVTMLCSMLIVIYSVSQLVVKPIVNAMIKINTSTTSTDNEEEEDEYEREQEHVALVTNLRIEEGEGGGEGRMTTLSSSEEEEREEHINTIVSEDHGEEEEGHRHQNRNQQHPNIIIDDRHPEQQQHQHQHQHQHQQIPTIMGLNDDGDDAFVPFVPATIILMNAIPATVMQDGITYHS
jgi:hypothetical protein